MDTPQTTLDLPVPDPDLALSRDTVDRIRDVRARPPLSRGGWGEVGAPTHGAELVRVHLPSRHA